MEVRKNEFGDAVDTLDVVGLRCRKFITDSNDKIAEVARIVTEAKKRIDRDGEEFPGGFDHWIKVYVIDPPWDVRKLLTFGGWRETKKTGEIAPVEVIAAKVAAIKATRAAGDRAARAAKKSARTYLEPAAAPAVGETEEQRRARAAEIEARNAEQRAAHPGIYLTDGPLSLVGWASVPIARVEPEPLPPFDPGIEPREPTEAVAVILSRMHSGKLDIEAVAMICHMDDGERLQLLDAIDDL